MFPFQQFLDSFPKKRKGGDTMDLAERVLQELARKMNLLDDRKDRHVSEGLGMLLAWEPDLRLGFSSLSYAESHVLQCVAEEPDLYGIAIARKLGMTRGGVSKAAARLVEKGLLTPRKGEKGNKIVLYSLTPLGEKVSAVHKYYHEAAMEHYMECIQSFSQDEQKTILAFLEKL